MTDDIFVPARLGGGVAAAAGAAAAAAKGHILVAGKWNFQHFCTRRTAHVAIPNILMPNNSTTKFNENMGIAPLNSSFQEL